MQKITLVKLIFFSRKKNENVQNSSEIPKTFLPGIFFYLLYKISKHIVKIFSLFNF
jgi:hypothetical protein